MVISRILMPGGWRGAGIAIALLLILATTLYVPAALAFPHRREIGSTIIYSVEPVPDVIIQRLQRADQLLSASPLNEVGLERTLVLTDGGWRWKIMALGTSRAKALRRPFSNTLIFNQTNVLADQVRNNEPIGGVRTLSGTIAHETVHILTARRLGEWGLVRLPEWKREGYADYVANEPSINENGPHQSRGPEQPCSRLL